MDGLRLLRQPPGFRRVRRRSAEHLLVGIQRLLARPSMPRPLDASTDSATAKVLPLRCYLSVRPKISTPKASSIFDSISRVRFSLPFTMRETYCWLHPSIPATCACVQCISSILSNILTATACERRSHALFARRHSASSRHFDGVEDWYFLNLSTAVPITFDYV